MYVAEWEVLADALARVLATGLEPEQAKSRICSKIDDREIKIRVKVDHTDPDIPGQFRYSQQIELPPNLRPEDLDWVLSKPLAAWETSPNHREEVLDALVWRPRRIARLDLWTVDVIDIFGSATGTGSDTAAKDIIQGTSEAISSEIEPVPALTDNPPVGFLFIDAGIEQAMARFGISEGPAQKRLVDVMHSGDVRTWKRIWNCYGPDYRERVPPAAWEGAHVDLEEFRARGDGGLIFRGSHYHLRRFLISAEDFDCWLAQVSPMPRPVPELPVEAIPGTLHGAGAVVAQPTLRRGRQPARHWERIHGLVRAILEQEGIPASGDGEQTKLESLVKDELAKSDIHPAVSTIRRHVTKAIETYRHDLG